MQRYGYAEVWLWLLENRDSFLDGFQNGDVFDARRLDL
jgi:hypothetical protein